VLHDPLGVFEGDRSHSLNEDRFRLVGMAATGRLLIVIVAIDESGTIRIISARRPTRCERHAYESQESSPLEC